MMAFAPSKRRSRWRSRKAGWPLWTRRPSHTPSPRTKPASNTDTTARPRGTSSPFTQMRMRSLRGSSSKSCVPWAMREPYGFGLTALALDVRVRAALPAALVHTRADRALTRVPVRDDANLEALAGQARDRDPRDALAP